MRLCRCPKGAAASREGCGINASGDAEAKASGVKLDQNSPDLRIVMANSESSWQQRGPKCRIKGPNAVPFNPFNPEFALGISENIGGRVKKVKKVKCYNVDTGEP
jgi:hypothetical protein